NAEAQSSQRKTQRTFLSSLRFLSVLCVSALSTQPPCRPTSPSKCCRLILIAMPPSTAPSRRIGVVLFQLGGPDSIDAVEPFLYNLFSDPDIIDFPLASIARRPLARLISKSRARHVGHHYAEIGGRSPILDLTLQQAAALERELRTTFDARVV